MSEAEDPVEIFDRYADEYAARFMDVSAYAPAYDAFCACLPPHAEVLELGCGPGNVTRHMLTVRPDLRVHATDMSARMLAITQALNPTATTELVSATNFGTLGRTWQGIMMGFVLPYLAPEEVERMISETAGVLTPGGMICLATMEGPPERSGIQVNSKGERCWIEYYLGATLRLWLEAAGFEIYGEWRTPAVTGDCDDLVLVARLRDSVHG